ncbi:hypothetical protein CTEN210_18649 [Chaetoceros tenuissimus]|uniref:Uncharacterized protein n=1 Tax=Chaetoceros tenuissimus TaxID=426638 RepID=A0AAD3DD26_9STRA|nr:hypothetical protein CTEN210_18649 [Chaetoceros tenuissimus]
MNESGNQQQQQQPAAENQQGQSGNVNGLGIDSRQRNRDRGGGGNGFRNFKGQIQELPVMGTKAESNNQNTANFIKKLAAYILVNFKNPSMLAKAVSELEDPLELLRNELPDIGKIAAYLQIVQAEPVDNETEAQRANRLQQNSMAMAPANALNAQEVSQFAKKKSLLQENMAKLWGIILGQCTKALVENLRAEHDFEKQQSEYNAIWLLKSIKRVVHSVTTSLNPIHTAFTATRDFYKTKQFTKSLEDYQADFENAQELVAQAGVDIVDHEDLLKKEKAKDPTITPSNYLIAIGRDLMFPLNIELRPLPSLNESNQSELYEYLRSMSNNSKFATEVAKILIEERRKSMRDRVNSSKTLPTFKVGDVVKVHIQVQSSAENNKVGKLSYQIRGPYQIVKDHGNNSYDVQRYGQPNGAIKKHQACDLYLLPPNLYPSDPLDTLDQRFLNYDHPPIQNPLHRPLRIESRADQFLFPPTIIQQPLQDQPEHHLDIEAIAPHLPTPPSPPSTPPPSASASSSSTPTLNPSTSPSLHDSILASHDKLFFIKYTPTGAIRERWYLIQIHLVSTEDANLDPI